MKNSARLTPCLAPRFLRRSFTLRPARQKGFVLFIALIMLVLITMVTITSVQTAGMEERMAGNARERNVAFQAAEAAVQFCLVQLKTDSGVSAGLNILAPNGYTLAARWDVASTWTGADSTAVSLGAVTVSRLTADPRCLVERLGAAGTTSFRVTGRAVGGSGDAIVLIQATMSPE